MRMLEDQGIIQRLGVRLSCDMEKLRIIAQLE